MGVCCWLSSNYCNILYTKVGWTFQLHFSWISLKKDFSLSLGLAYTPLLHIKQIKNKDLTYSTGNYDQYLIIANERQECIYMCVCIYTYVYLFLYIQINTYIQTYMYIHSKKKKKEEKTFPKGYQSGKEPLSETLFQLYWGNLCSFCVTCDNCWKPQHLKRFKIWFLTQLFILKQNGSPKVFKWTSYSVIKHLNQDVIEGR